MRLRTVSRNYDRLAPVYDLADRWLIQPFVGMQDLRGATVRALGLARGDTVLDIGCGTGLNLPLLVDAVGPEGRVVALDYSDGMLRRARARVKRHGWRNVELVQGDAARLEGVEGPFDAVMSTWAMGIVDDLPAALDRAVSVLKPGGRLAILDLHRTRAQRGVRRHIVDPVVHFALRCSGVDSAEDLDGERLQRRWAAGKAQLEALLVDVHQETNVGDSGFLLYGAKAST